MAYSTLAGRLKRLIASFRQHGFGHVLEVLRQSCVRQAYARTPHGLPERSDFLRSFAALQSSSESVVHHLMLTSRRLLMPWMEEDHGVRQQLLSTRSLDEFRKDADLIASGRFTGLGVGIVEPSGKFDWYRDYVSGKVWPLQSFHQIRFLQGDGADIKYPWELSRMYWIGWLGLARSVEQPSADNDPRAESFKDLIDDWRESNPINIGPNWAMPMEVGIRGFWLVMGAAFFGDSETLSDEWWGDYYRLLWGHGNYLDNNLEYFPNLTNHYIANCFGLLTVGALFIETGKGKRWFDKGKKRLAKELFRQVTEDGVHYERSVSYHALVLEMYLIALIVAERVGQPFNPNEKLQVSRMAAFLRDCIPPGKATAPQLGDSDDGVILRLSSCQELYNYCGLLLPNALSELTLNERRQRFQITHLCKKEMSTTYLFICCLGTKNVRPLLNLDPVSTPRGGLPHFGTTISFSSLMLAQSVCMATTIHFRSHSTHRTAEPGLLIREPDVIRVMSRSATNFVRPLHTTPRLLMAERLPDLPACGA